MMTNSKKYLTASTIQEKKIVTTKYELELKILDKEIVEIGSIIVWDDVQFKVIGKNGKVIKLTNIPFDDYVENPVCLLNFWDQVK